MIIGPHVEPMSRQQAYQVGWKCFQINFGNPKSSQLPNSFVAETRYEQEPFWFWHVPFVLHAAPKDAPNTRYFLNAMRAHGDKLNAAGCVIHTGTVSGIPIDTVLERMQHFLQTLESHKTPLLIEFGACVCGFNMNPERFVDRFCKEGSGIGYCLDLAHVFAAGCTWKQISDIINERPPEVVHINYPGTDYGSSKDIHGWRTTPTVMYAGKQATKKRPDWEQLTQDYDNIIRLLHEKQVPMIVEGSGFPGCDVLIEMETIKGLIG